MFITTAVVVHHTDSPQPADHIIRRLNCASGAARTAQRWNSNHAALPSTDRGKAAGAGACAVCCTGDAQGVCVSNGALGQWASSHRALDPTQGQMG